MLESSYNRTETPLISSFSNKNVSSIDNKKVSNKGTGLSQEEHMSFYEFQGLQELAKKNIIVKGMNDIYTHNFNAPTKQNLELIKEYGPLTTVEVIKRGRGGTPILNIGKTKLGVKTYSYQFENITAPKRIAIMRANLDYLGYFRVTDIKGGQAVGRYTAAHANPGPIRWLEQAKLSLASSIQKAEIAGESRALVSTAKGAKVVSGVVLTPEFISTPALRFSTVSGEGFEGLMNKLLSVPGKTYGKVRNVFYRSTYPEAELSTYFSEQAIKGTLKNDLERAGSAQQIINSFKESELKGVHATTGSMPSEFNPESGRHAFGYGDQGLFITPRGLTQPRFLRIDESSVVGGEYVNPVSKIAASFKQPQIVEVSLTDVKRLPSSIRGGNKFSVSNKYLLERQIPGEAHITQRFESGITSEPEAIISPATTLKQTGNNYWVDFRGSTVRISEYSALEDSKIVKGGIRAGDVAKMLEDYSETAGYKSTAYVPVYPSYSIVGSEYNIPYESGVSSVVATQTAYSPVGDYDITGVTGYEPVISPPVEVIIYDKTGYEPVIPPPTQPVYKPSSNYYPPTPPSMPSLLRPPPILIGTSTNKSYYPGYAVSLRRKGSFRIIGTGLTQREAFNLGAGKVRTTSAATFKLFKLGTVTKKGYGLGRMDDFYRKADLFIQKRGKRISSFGELRDITFKGLRSLRFKNAFGF